MAEIQEAIRCIEEQVNFSGARCAIADEGFPGESSLFGTRDGLLNLALALLRFVASADAGECLLTDQGYFWDDGLKATLYQLPTPSAWLVGVYLFQNHQEFMHALSQVVDPQLEYPLLNDPQFRAPEE